MQQDRGPIPEWLSERRQCRWIPSPHYLNQNHASPFRNQFGYECCNSIHGVAPTAPRVFVRSRTICVSLRRQRLHCRNHSKGVPNPFACGHGWQREYQGRADSGRADHEAACAKKSHHLQSQSPRCSEWGSWHQIANRVLQPNDKPCRQGPLKCQTQNPI